MQPRRVAGFTLIEMLVVIAIISLLAAIVFPVFGRARETARRSSCASNLKQIGLAFEQYKNDYDSYIAPVETSTMGWPTLINPYLKSEQVYHCPDAEMTNFLPDKNYIDITTGSLKNAYCGAVKGDASLSALSVITDRNFAYTRNAIPDVKGSWVTTTWGAFNTATSTAPTAGRISKQGFINLSETRPLNEAQVEDAAGTINVFDGISGSKFASPVYGTASTGCSASAQVRIDTEVATDRYLNAEGTKPSYRHFGGFNALYGDAHVKWVMFGTTKAENWTIQAD